jgi:predicted metal-binding membrane protein
MAEQGEAHERWLYAGAMAALIGGAWASLGLLGASAYAPYLSHDFLAEAGDLGPALGRVAVFLLGWTLMSIAMMLPSSLPLVTVFHTITSGAWRLVLLLVAGYLWIWGLFGLAALVADAGLHTLVESSSWLGRRPHLIPATLLLTAGLFQFSPLKHSCLERCRSPIGFVIQHWRGGGRALRAFTLGVRHGIFCVGCCWALMLLMFGAGAVNLGWMLVLGAVMFVEKAVDWGRWITAPAGVLLALWGLALFLKIPGVPAPF